ncbi:MAG: helix-turn-helix domain-containing protein [Chloroflexota bacterium]
MSAYRRVPIWPELAAHVVGILVQEATPNAKPPDAPAPRASVSDALRPILPVLPAPWPVLGFQFQGRLAVERECGQHLLERSGITLLQATARRFVPVDGALSVLVTLQPSAAYALLGRPLHELADQHLGLADLLPAADIRMVEERLAAARTTDERATVVQRLLAARFRTAGAVPHDVVEEAVQQILTRGGRVQVRSLALDLGISERQLERLFREQIGAGPKRFAALVQFDHAVQQMSRGESWSALALEAGYADQSHLTRTFTARTGLPPSGLRALLGQSDGAVQDVEFLQDPPPAAPIS